MALSEFVAMEDAYRALLRLDAAGRRRALRWLTDALDVEEELPSASPGEVTAAPVPAEAAPAVEEPPAAAGKRSGRRNRRRGGGAAPDGQRPYRRMPPAEEVLAAYRQAGTLTALAEHYNVPRHTVQGWARRLRSEGYPIGRAE